MMILFDRNIEKYSEADHPQKVFIGPSYAQLFGNAFGAINLGIGGATERETDFILKNICRPDDQKIYVINIYEILNTRKGIRAEIQSSAKRKLAIFKQVVTAYIGGLFYGNLAPAAQGPPPLTKEDLQEIDFLFNLHEGDLVQRKVNAEIHQYQDIKDPDIEGTIDHYKKLQMEDSHLTFVYIPIIPVDKRREERETSDIQRDYQKFKDLDDLFRETLLKKKVRMIDLSGVLDKSIFYGDLFHPNNVGYIKSIEELRKKGVL